MSDQGPALLALYDSALPEVYGYLVRRCDGTSVAEDLTSETFSCLDDQGVPFQLWQPAPGY